MSNIDVIRAWKDESYRSNLTIEERASLPEHPAGMVEIDDVLLNGINGGTTGFECFTFVTFAISCSINCPTIFQGSCAILSVGCC